LAGDRFEKATERASCDSQNSSPTATTGDNNTATGFQALDNNTISHDNTAIGTNALLNNSTGTLNTAIGENSLQNNTIGSSNTVLGTFAGSGITTAINVAQQHEEFEAAVAELKGQVQKVSAQLELNKSAPRTVLNNQ
jgi:hypothetical protein